MKGKGDGGCKCIERRSIRGRSGGRAGETLLDMNINYEFII